MVMTWALPDLLRSLSAKAATGMALAMHATSQLGQTQPKRRGEAGWQECEESVGRSALSDGETLASVIALPREGERHEVSAQHFHSPPVGNPV